jgi:hypothetical protein
MNRVGPPAARAAATPEHKENTPDKLSRQRARARDRQALKQERRQRRELTRRRQAAGLSKPSAPGPASRCSPYSSVEDECAARTDALLEQACLMNAALSTLLPRLRWIEDPRQPKKIKHALPCLMLYGILVFVLQFASRRAANAQMTRPMFEDNLRLLFPELDELPHADTLYRLLCKIEVSQIEQAHIELIRRLMRKKKFVNYLINNCYPLAIDGTQKLVYRSLCSDSLQQRRISAPSKDDPTQEPVYEYYVYVLEANLCFHNGMVIPLMSEFLDYQKGDREHNKQDCETRAFHRLAERIKQAFPKLPVMLLLDGLYPSGPVFERCRQNHWDFMIVLKDASLSALWKEYHALQALTPKQQYCQNWGNRRQHFRWVNDIRYEYGPNAGYHLDLHVVQCREEWEDLDERKQIVIKTASHAWISSRKLWHNNVHERCNLAARHRWGIESCILVEKHQGYHYEHRFAQNWNAMRGYHYLMRLAHLLNTLARFSSALAKIHLELGVRGFIQLVRSTYSGPWLDPAMVTQRMQNRVFRLRLT